MMERTPSYAPVLSLLVDSTMSALPGCAEGEGQLGDGTYFSVETKVLSGEPCCSPERSHPRVEGVKRLVAEAVSALLLGPFCLYQL